MRSDSYNTKSKQMILDFLTANSERTVDVAEISKYLKDNDYEVNVTTIYRCLDKLVANNLISKYTDDSGKKATYRFVGENSCCHEHLHLQCSGCGKIIHLDCEFMDELIEHITKKHDFDLRCDKSILYGKCKECSEKEKNKL